MKPGKIIALVLVAAFAAFSFGGSAEAKKNYRYRKSFAVTGDGSNADASVKESGLSSETKHYRDITFSGLRMANPYPFRVFHQCNPSFGFGEECWNVFDRYFITDGNLWIHYGNTSTWGGETTYSDYATGNFRYFGYYGGTKKKKRRNSAYKTYEFSATGSEADADATAKENSSVMTYYYRKVAVPELKMDNLVDYQLYSKNSFYQGFDAESWMFKNSYFFVTDGYLYVAYGYKYTTAPGIKGTAPDYQFQSFSSQTFRFFIYSDGKRKKNRLKKQYAKRYNFSIPNDPASADKVATYTDSDGYTTKEYYKKYRIKGSKMASYPNVKLMKKNNFASGYTDESWSQNDYTITNGYIWVAYGYELIEPGNAAGAFENTGSGDYRVFVYR